MLSRLQIHYTYMETGVGAEERFGGGVDCVQGRDDTLREQTFGIQCVHTLKTHEKSMQIVEKESLGRKTWRVEEWSPKIGG